MRLIPQLHHIGERDRFDQFVVLVLNLDERGSIDLTVEKVARHDASKAPHCISACSRIVGKLDTFLVLCELKAVAQVEVETRHEHPYTIPTTLERANPT